MKVNIGAYVNFYGPYQIAEKLLFWKDKDNDDTVHKFGKYLAENKQGKPSLLANFCEWLHAKKKRKVQVKVHDYDVWNADHTLALIALPLIKRLRDEKHSSAFVEDLDVPEELRSTSAPPKENDWDTDEFVHLRWQWVLSEIIFALEAHVDSDEEQKFYDQSQVNEDDNLMTQVGSIKVDREGLEAFEERKQNGFRLLGVYWQGLWS